MLSLCSAESGPRPRSVVWRAPAKLNLFLEVLGKRPDGYHELETLLAAIDRWDTLVLRAAAPERLALACRWAPGLTVPPPDRRGAAEPGASPWGELPVAGENLVLRALRLLRERSGAEAGAEAVLEKRIPLQAGLGGASSDAAAALAAANALWGLKWPWPRLAELAAELGSDVAFFLAPPRGAGLAAVCRGRGERVEVRPAAGGVWFVVVKPPAGLATADVYRRCRPAERPRSAEAAVAALARGDAAGLAAALGNGLQAPAAELCPWIERACRALAEAGCIGQQMSGSGTCCFGVCGAARQARAAAARLRARGWSGAFAAGLAAPQGSAACA